MEPKARLNFDPRLQLPNHAVFVGATQSGKSTLCLKLLLQPRLFTPPPKRILLHYDQLQTQYLAAKKSLEAQGIELCLYKGFPDVTLDTVLSDGGQTILVIDDFSEESSSNQEIARIATNGRHKNLSLWLVWHSLYSGHALSRIICQNIRWFFFLPSLRLESQLRTFGCQLGMKKRILQAFKMKATLSLTPARVPRPSCVSGRQSTILISSIATRDQICAHFIPVTYALKNYKRCHKPTQLYSSILPLHFSAR